MMPSSVKDAHLSWHRSFVRRERKSGEQLLCIHFKLYGRREIGELLKTPRRQSKQFNNFYVHVAGLC